MQSPAPPRTAELQPLTNRTRSNPTVQAVRPLAQPPEKPRVSALPAPRPASARPGSVSPAVPPRSPSPAEGHHAVSPGVTRGSALTSQVGSAPPSSRREVLSTPSHSTAPQRLVGAGSDPAKTAAVGRLPGVPETVVSSLSAGPPRPTATQQDPLAGAFAKAVVATSAQTEPQDHPLAGDEWYVGVNDQPIGPIRLAEIRDRAARGEVTSECLVWRDGFEDWKPLIAFPELVAVVEEGLASLRSLRPPAPSPQAALAVQLPSPMAMQLQPLPTVATSSAAALDEESLAVAGLSKPKIPITAWFAVFAALALGVTFGLVVIRPEAPKEVIKYVEVPASRKVAGAEAPPPAPVAEGASNSLVGNGESAAVAEKRSGAAVRKSSGNGTGDTAAAVPTSEVPQGLKGLQGLQGLGAPKTGPVSGDVSSSSSGRQQLDSATLSRTVSRYTASVKRSCWQPALDTRTPDASTSARISANIVVAPSGKVQSVTVSPDPKGYRGLSSCIQGRVRNWEFPPAGGTTEFNVPFVFAAQ